ncbi:aspartate ammonia-lyase [Actinomadura nitritigenes]|nr:aspartate ammonia-lyase [Actinomadura nitritigenes]
MTGQAAGVGPGKMRVEHDLLGERVLPEDVRFGIQTLRATENFRISGVSLAQFSDFIVGLAHVKKAAALANHELGLLAADKARAIATACDEIAAGRMHDEFVVDMVQGGAGTSTNMNANEVIANRALELMGHGRGDYQWLHPNDDVNRSQSTNDAYPTAVKIGVYLSMQRTLSAMGELKAALADRAAAFADVIKMGRTQLQDAVPMTLGQEFAAYAVMVGESVQHLRRAGDDLLAVGMGATAVGTGINTVPGYAERVVQKLAEVSRLPVRRAEDLVEATQDSGHFVQLSATLKRAAVQISKICNDLRLLSSGPRAGLGEIRLPAVQPGSSIMPGKVNPVIPEVVNQVCFQIIGYDLTVTLAADAGQLELNMAEPIIAFDLLHGLKLLRNACSTLTHRCVLGIEADRERCRGFVEGSVALATALIPVLGYDRSVAVAAEAQRDGTAVRDIVVRNGWLAREDLDRLLRPESMTAPGPAADPGRARVGTRTRVPEPRPTEDR